jgi:hypothetical protein
MVVTQPKTNEENLFYFIFCVLRGIDPPHRAAELVADYYLKSDLATETNKSLAEINKMLTEDAFWRLLNSAKPEVAIGEIMSIWE